MRRLLAGLLPLVAGLAQVGKSPASNKLWIRDARAVNAPWRPIGRAQRLVSMTALNGRLYGASSTGFLVVREPALSDVPWTIIGHAQQLAAMTALGGNLYAAGLAGQLWMRPPVHRDMAWKKIGTAKGVIAMASSEGNIYAVNTEGHLLVWVDAAHPPVRWVDVGRLERVTALAALDGRLYAATSDNRLLVREAAPEDRPWTLIAHAENVTAMTAFNGKLYAAAYTPSILTVPRNPTTCALWETNHLYWEARALLQTARQAGRIKDRQQCLGLANDSRALKTRAGSRDLADLIAGSCAQCACAAEF